MSLGNVADITSTGLLRLTNDIDGTYQMSFVYYSHQIRFKNNNTGGGGVFSFSTSFIFSIVPESPGLRGLGIAFIIAPQAELPAAKGSDLPGLFDQRNNNSQPTNFVIAIEIDTIHNNEYDTIQGDHVGIDFNNLASVISKPSGYYMDNNGSSFRNLSLISGDPIRVWIEYDEVSKNLTVTLAPLTVPKPATPLLSYTHDLSDLLLDSMYVGFSSATSFAKTSHYVLGWSFMINNGTDLPIDVSQLPKLPARQQKSKRAAAKFLGVELPIIIPVLALTFTIGILFVLRIIRNRKLGDDVVEDWELNYERLRFSFKHLYTATNGFKEKNLLGNGGFGKVYKGVLPASKVNVAVKRISHNSKQGVREFISEIISIGHLRHRNLANGSLDKLLFHKYDSASAAPPALDWNQRFQIIKGVAFVVHRDIKASNVLLDGEMNARLGDFGLARLYDRGTNPKTTNVAGTLGYMAPELIRTGKATTSSDVFGALLLEVACGRRPIELNVPESEESEILVDWVLNRWRSGAILQTSDPLLGNEYIKEEMELVLKLGLLCSQNDANARPSTRQAMQYLDGELPLPQTELWALYYTNSTVMTSSGEHRSCKGSMSPSMSRTSSVAESLLSGPR
ncbi:hypothetical protein MKW98_032128 [Papaver atlanticum]|uniref:non-specific serine/threonine protein kinase n=1 Tax=Papaver atlanticum TaxID=357466 RepID=A0AAD4SFN7_9MAGN|nr:hypothetical protein MKW98_032128 [Papaver atlanticum]